MGSSGERIMNAALLSQVDVISACAYRAGQTEQDSSDSGLRMVQIVIGIHAVEWQL